MPDETEQFIDAFAASLSAETFVKMTLGNYKGDVEHLQKILVRPVETKRGTFVAFQSRYESRETVKNHSIGESPDTVRSHLRSGFRNAHLFTTANDFQLDIGKRSTRLRVGRATFTEVPGRMHDRAKNHLVDPGRYYLKALGITNDRGEVKAEQQDKWRQINKFVETFAQLIERSALVDRRKLKIVDMGAGKGYLTFAAYDHLTVTRGLEIDMTGVDLKPETIDLCNDVAAACGFDGLKFVVGAIADFDPTGADILVALHACDTATDDALYKGIQAGSQIIVAAPCCHKEVRKQIKPPAGMKTFLKHGTLLETTAEVVTDGLRSLLLERSGYNTKVFEFVSPEHTPKNNMIAAVKAARPVDRDRLNAEIVAVKSLYSIERQRLEHLLA